MAKVRLWTKDYVTITTVNFFAALNFYLLMIVVSSYAIERFDAATSQAGLAASVFVVGALIARVFVGRWLGRISHKTILLVGLAGSLAMSLLYFGAASMSALFVVRFLHGAAFGVTSTAAATIAADLVPAERRGEGIGYFSLSQTLATAIGPFLGVLLSRSGDYTTIFIACALVAAVSLILAPLLARRPLAPQHEEPSARRFRIASFIEPHVVPIATISLLMFLSYSSIVSFLTVYAREIDLVDAAGLFFVVYAVFVLVTRPFSGRLFDVRGENSVMYPAIAAFAVGLALFSQARQGWVLLASAAVIGIGLGSAQSTMQAISVKVTPTHRVGLANSTFLMLSDIGMGIGPVLVGALIPALGYRGMYLTMAAVAAVSLGLYLLLHGRTATLNRAY